MFIFIIHTNRWLRSCTFSKRETYRLSTHLIFFFLSHPLCPSPPLHSSLLLLSPWWSLSFRLFYIIFSLIERWTKRQQQVDSNEGTSIIPLISLYSISLILTLCLSFSLSVSFPLFLSLFYVGDRQHIAIRLDASLVIM